MDKNRQIVDDLSEHVLQQSLEALHRAVNLVPDGLEAALMLQVFFRFTFSTAQILPFDAWEDMKPGDKIRALVKLMESAMNPNDGLEISNREVHIVPRRSRRGW